LWIPGLGIVIALLVCIGLMTHVASTDADTLAVAASAAPVSADLKSGVLSDSLSGETQLSPSADGIELCAFFGVMCVLMLLILRNLTAVPRRNDQCAPRQRTDVRGTFAALFGGPVTLPALMVPLRV
jgi:hypothetical protein